MILSPARPLSAKTFVRIAAKGAALTLLGLACTAGLSSAHAAGVVGHKSCGKYATVPPSAIKPNGTSTVAVALYVKAVKDFEDTVTCLINAERKAKGLKALTTSPQLHKAAFGAALDAMKIRWWSNGANPHNNPKTGSTPDSRIRATGYCGGNIKRDSEIAYTWASESYETTPIGAVNWWMNISKGGHREAILNNEITQIGVGAGGIPADGKLPTTGSAGTYVVNFGACN
jgi:uncharacterized protein YkwD